MRDRRYSGRRAADGFGNARYRRGRIAFRLDARPERWQAERGVRKAEERYGPLAHVPAPRPKESCDLCPRP